MLPDFFAVSPLEKCRRGSIMKTCMIIVIVTPEYGYGTGLKTGREIYFEAEYG